MISGSAEPMHTRRVYRQRTLRVPERAAQGERDDHSLSSLRDPQMHPRLRKNDTVSRGQNAHAIEEDRTNDDSIVLELLVGGLHGGYGPGHRARAACHRSSSARGVGWWWRKERESKAGGESWGGTGAR